MKNKKASISNFRFHVRYYASMLFHLTLAAKSTSKSKSPQVFLGYHSESDGERHLRGDTLPCHSRPKLPYFLNRMVPYCPILAFKRGKVGFQIAHFALKNSPPRHHCCFVWVGAESRPTNNTNKGKIIKWQKVKICDSNVVPHRSTRQTRACLTSLSRREAVLSCWYVPL